MSIAKKRDKSASTASEKAKGWRPSMPPRSTTRNPRVRALIRFMEANLSKEFIWPNWRSLSRS